MLLRQITQQNRTRRTVGITDQRRRNLALEFASVTGGSQCRCLNTLDVSRGTNHTGQRCNQLSRRRIDHAGVLDQRIIAGHIDRINLSAVTCGIAQTLSNQRCILTQETTYNQGRIDIAQISQWQTQPRRGTRALRISAEILLTQAEIDIVRTQRTRDTPCQRHFFQRGMRADHRSNLVTAMILGNAAQTVSHIIQRNVPLHFLPLTTLLQHRLEQALITIQCFVRETVFIGDPALIDALVIQRQYALDHITLDLNCQVSAGRIVWRHRFAALQFPRTSRVTERLRRQCTHRATVDHIARQFGVYGTTDEGRDFRVNIAVYHAQFHDAGHFLAKAHATGTVNATAHFFHRNQRADVLVEHHMLFFGEARSGLAITNGQILQLTFTTLVTNRTI